MVRKSVLSSATPTEAEIAAWHDLPCDEQLRRLRAAVTHRDACTVSPGGMDDVWAQTNARRQRPTQS